MNAEYVELGFMAPPIGEQFPELPEDVADAFTKDSIELSRLRMRGYITDSQRASIIKKLTKAIERELIKSTNKKKEFKA